MEVVRKCYPASPLSVPLMQRERSCTEGAQPGIKELVCPECGLERICVY